MSRQRRGGGRLRAGGGRTHKVDCCCDGCAATTAQGVCEYLRDNGYQAKVEVEAADYDDNCTLGNCTPIEGMYSLPYQSDFGGADVHGIIWEDSFSITACTAPLVVTVTVTLLVDTTGSSFDSSLTVQIQTGFSIINCSWFDTFVNTECNQFLGFAHSLPAADSGDLGTPCKTIAATSGPVDVELSL